MSYQVVRWYRLARLARSSGGDRYEPVPIGTDSPRTSKVVAPVPPADVIYLNQDYSRALIEPFQVVRVTFDFGEEEEGE